MEVNGTYPILVAFASHDVLLILKVPYLPSAVIASSSYNLLLGMERHASNTPRL